MNETQERLMVTMERKQELLGRVPGRREKLCLEVGVLVPSAVEAELLEKRQAAKELLKARRKTPVEGWCYTGTAEGWGQSGRRPFRSVRDGSTSEGHGGKSESPQSSPGAATKQISGGPKRVGGNTRLCRHRAKRRLVGFDDKWQLESLYKEGLALSGTVLTGSKFLKRVVRRRCCAGQT